MKILVVFYSRTGTTKKAAQMLAEKIGSEIEEIKDTVDRNGAKGYLISGKQATLRELTVLENSQNNPGEFDLVIIGSPIWSWNISTPVRTYLENHKDEFKKLAFFCTMGGSGDKRAIKDIEKITDLKIENSVALTTIEVVKNNFEEKIEKFGNEINSIK